METMTDKLLNCPFCGGKAFEYYSGSQFEFCEVVCKECGCRSKRKTEAEAIKAWNTRKPMNEIVEKLDETFDRWGLDDGKKDIMREIVKGGAE